MSSSVLVSYREAERQIEELKARLDLLGREPALIRDLEFESKLQGLMAEYSISPARVLAVLGHIGGEAVKPKRFRTRFERVYRNPNTGEEIKTVGGPHKILAGWRKQYGYEKVQEWLVTQ